MRAPTLSTAVAGMVFLGLVCAGLLHQSAHAGTRTRDIPDLIKAEVA